MPLKDRYCFFHVASIFSNLTTTEFQISEGLYLASTTSHNASQLHQIWDYIPRVDDMFEHIYM